MNRKAPFKDQRTLTERRHAKAIDALHRAENELARALQRWQKARQTVKRYDKRADHDWREIAKSADKIQDPEPSDDVPDWKREHAQCG